MSELTGDAGYSLHLKLSCPSGDEGSIVWIPPTSFKPSVNGLALELVKWIEGSLPLVGRKLTLKPLDSVGRRVRLQKLTSRYPEIPPFESLGEQKDLELLILSAKERMGANGGVDRRAIAALSATDVGALGSILLALLIAYEFDVVS